MKKILLLILTTTILLFSCKSKNIVKNKLEDNTINYIPYYLKMYKADSLFLVNDFGGSFIILDSLFKIYKPLNLEGWYEYNTYLACSVMSGNTKNIVNKIKYGYKNFGDIQSIHPEYIKLNNAVKKASNLTDDEINSLKKIYFSKLNSSLRDEIIKMKIDDQYVRVTTNDDVGMKKYQELHYIELKKIFRKYGYPNAKKIGSDNYFENSADIGAILMHQSFDAQIEFLPIILDWVKKGECDPRIYAAVYDKNLWGIKGLQYYGTFPNNKPNNFNYPDLSNPKKIDSLRKSIGLPNINYNDWRNKKIFEESN